MYVGAIVENISGNFAVVLRFESRIKLAVFIDAGRTGRLIERYEEISKVSPETGVSGRRLGEEMIERVELCRRKWVEDGDSFVLLV